MTQPSSEKRVAQRWGEVPESPKGVISGIRLTFHENSKNISEGWGCRSKGTDGEEEGADGVSCLILRL
jgi:hypothetical protein